MTHLLVFTSHSEVSCSGSGLPGSQLYLRNFSRRKCGCSVPGPLSNLAKWVLTTQMLQFPKGTLTPMQ